MVDKQDFTRISPVQWEIPTSFRQDMRVPVRFFASERLLEATLGDITKYFKNIYQLNQSNISY